MGDAAVRVATVITRLEGGAGSLALRGALMHGPGRPRDDDHHRAGAPGAAWTGPPRLPGGRHRARAAGAGRAVQRPGGPCVRLRRPVHPAGPSTSCTRTRPRPGRSGVSAARRRGAAPSCTPTTAFPSTSSRQLPRRQAYVRDRARGWAGSPTWRCAWGPGWPSRRSAASSSHPSGSGPSGWSADGPAGPGWPPRRVPAAAYGGARGRARPRRAARGDRGRRGRAADLPEGAGGLPGRAAGAGPARRDRGLGRVTGNWPGRWPRRPADTRTVRLVLARASAVNVPELLPAFDVVPALQPV